MSEFDKHGDAVGLGNPAATGLTPQQTVVAASLVQAEAGTADDAPRSRPSSPTGCAQGMPLQIDATLCYAKGGCPPVPTNADKQIDSPYNTYRVTGLPPTPIMTVTEPSLRGRARTRERPLSVLRDRQGWSHLLRDHAGGARSRTSPRRTE